jgi:hypothetical protein
MDTKDAGRIGGRIGGKAKGASKVRGDAEYYRALRAKVGSTKLATEVPHCEGCGCSHEVAFDCVCSCACHNLRKPEKGLRSGGR